MTQSSRELQAVGKIQALFRGYQTRRATRRLRKMLNYRRHILKQIIETEQNYIYDLSLIISDFKYPFRSMKLVGSQDLALIFSNIQEIKKLNQELYCELVNRFQGYWHYKSMFDVVIRLSPFFKIYFEYCKNYEQGQKTILRLRRQKPEFDEYVRQKCRQTKFRQLGIDGFLIKPIQRLPKYVLLFKDLLKHTPLDHPDYGNIQGALKAIDQVNIHNNESMTKVLSNMKLAELQQITGEPLIEVGRIFLFQQNVTILKQNDVKDVIMYLFNDLMLLTSRGTFGYQVQLKMALSRASFINELQDLCYYKNLFLVYGGEGDCCTIVCSTVQEKEKLMEMISNVVAKAAEKQVERARLFISNRINNESILRKIEQADYPVEVDVIGTEERCSNKLTKHTVYIIQVKIRNVKQKIFMRYRQLLDIQSRVSTLYPNMRSANNLPYGIWLGNHRNKVIQERKIAIQLYLQSLLSMRQVRESGKRILHMLGMPQDFYSLPQRFRISNDSTECEQKQPKSHSTLGYRSSYFDRCSTGNVSFVMQRLNTFNTEEMEQSEDSILKRRKKKFSRKESFQTKQQLFRKKLTVEELLQVNEMFLGHFTRNSEKRQSKQSTDDSDFSIPVHVHCQSLDDRVLMVQMKGRQRVQNLILVVAKMLQLKYFKDYRCFLEMQENQRILDDDELIQNISSEVHKFFYKSRVRFKKFIYIHNELQLGQLKEDPVRLKMLSAQLFCQVKRLSYRLTYQNYLVILSLFLLVNGCEPKGNHRSVQYVRRQLLPSGAYGQFSDEVWQEDIEKCYGVIFSELQTIRKANEQKKKNFQKKLETLRYSEVKENMTKIDMLARMALINQLKAHPLYGTILLIVQISQEARQRLDRSELVNRNQRNLWLSLRHDSLCFLQPHTFEVIKQYKYEQVLDLDCYPSSIKIIVDDEDEGIKMKTTKSFFLSQTILYYKKYSQVYEKLAKDDQCEHLIERARQHMQSITMVEDLEMDTVTQKTD